MKTKGKVSLFLDSGAYSAWTQGTEIDIDEYIQFCLDHLDIVEVVANLDVIPGKPYQRSNVLEMDSGIIEKSASKGWENYERMVAAGIPKDKIVHVFHWGENIKWLERMVEEMPYIGLSPGGDKSMSEKMAFLDRCMDVVCDEDGMPKVKFHGFGATSLRLMLRYPWYSVDSTTWVILSRMGGIMVPRYRDGQWVYDENSWNVSVSSRSPDMKKAGQHISTMSPRQQELVMRYIEEKGYVLGKSSFKQVSQTHTLAENERWAEKKPKDKTAKRRIEVIEEPGLCNTYTMRDEMNIIYYQDLGDTMPPWPWPFKREKQIRGFQL